MGCSVQIQSVLYKTEKENLLRALEHLNNALRVERLSGEGVSKATLVWGDASPSPVFSEAEITSLNERCGEFAEIKYVFFNENTGTAKGHNRLSSVSPSEYIMVMNPDVVVNPRIFRQLLAPFSDPLAGLTEARQTPVEHPKEYDIKTGETSWASTACVVFPKRVFDGVNGFDADTFFMYCDDVDFSWRVRLAGYKITYVPSAVVYHDKSLSKKGAWVPTEAERYYSTEAALLMAYKWSAPSLLAKLKKRFQKSEDEIESRALAEFQKRLRLGILPEKLDSRRQVSEFINENYGAMRF